MTHDTCLLSGCIFIDFGYARDAHERWVNGDLFAVGDCYVLHAVAGSGGGTCWQYPPASKRKAEEALEELRMGRWIGGYEFWERHGVIVLEKKLTVLSNMVLEQLVTSSVLDDPRWTEPK